MARILGLEIGRDAVRGTLLRTALRRAEVLRYVEAPVREVPAPPPGDEGAEPAEDPRVRAERLAVEACLHALGAPPDQIVAALDGREASLRTVEIPAAAAKRAAEVLPFELEPLLPFPTDEAVLDYQVIEREGQTLRLLAAAVPEARVERRLSELAALGVDPRELAVEPAALDGLAMLVPPVGEGLALCLHVRPGTADVCVLQAGEAAFARTLPLDEAWSREGSPFEGELRRTISAWRAAGGAALERAWLSGVLPPPDEHGPDDPVAWLARVLGVPAARVPLPPGEGADAGDLARFGLSAALAARTVERAKRFDLRRGRFAYTRAVGATQRYARVAAVGGAAVLLSFAFAVFAEWRVLASEHERLTAELERVSLEALGERTASPGRARELLARGSGADDPIPEVDAYDLLEHVSGAIDPGIPHTTRTFLVELDEEGGDGRFELVGAVGSIAERDRIAEAVEGHACLKELERGSTSAAPGTEARLRYQLEADVRCGEAAAPTRGRSRRGR